MPEDGILGSCDNFGLIEVRLSCVSRVNMNIIQCTFDSHAEQILEILNDAIVSSTALYDYHPRAPESMVPWFESKERSNFPVVGLEDDDGRLAGFASYGHFYARLSHE